VSQPVGGAPGPGVVVTGAARGIGRAIAARLAAEGARVVVNDLDADEVHDVARQLGAFAVPGDAATTDGVEALVDAATAHLGRIDTFFANAGIGLLSGLDTSDEDWDRVIQVNLMSHVRAARALVPRWLEQGGGRLVITASAAGLLTMLGDAPYSVTKHGAVAFAEWLSATYRHRGIVVQAICPQGVQTRMLDESGPLQDLLSHDEALTPEAVADAVWRGLQTDHLLILPHRQVREYYAHRATKTDEWLIAMNRLQQRLERGQQPNQSEHPRQTQHDPNEETR
jgi:NAD(P)-dependent dehydrogenase (short-subunit alcohol dehydrogenase family)